MQAQYRQDWLPWGFGEQVDARNSEDKRRPASTARKRARGQEESNMNIIEQSPRGNVLKSSEDSRK